MWRRALAADRISKIRAIEFADGSRAPLGRYLGSGNFGHVFCLDTPCTRVIKLPTAATLGNPNAYEVERETALALAAAGFDVAEISAVGPGQFPFSPKPTSKGRPWRRRKHGFSIAQIRGLARLFVTGLRSGQHPDLLGSSKSNLVWQIKYKRWVLVDTGGEMAGGVLSTERRDLPQRRPNYLDASPLVPRDFLRPPARHHGLRARGQTPPGVYVRAGLSRPRAGPRKSVPPSTAVTRTRLSEFSATAASIWTVQ